MKKLIFSLMLSVFAAQSAQAGDIEIPLEVSLVRPSLQSYINIDDCAIADEFELEISWSYDGVDVWEGSQEADVFLATTDDCTSAAVEIGHAAADGVDIDIADGATSGSFPASDDELFLSDVTGLSCSTETENDYYFCIKWVYDYVDLYGNDQSYTFRGGALLRFDNKKPAAPTDISISPGETNLKVSWEKPDDDDVDSYIVYYRAESSTTVNEDSVTSGEAEDHQITGLVNFTNYEVWVTAVDEALNESDDSEIETGMPEPVEDFYETYRNGGGSDSGGFCFVATAAFGSYQAGMVIPLRVFRDTILAQTAFGRDLIAGYYQYGPRWARAIRGSETHRAVARWTLAPAAAVASAATVLGPFELLILLAGLIILLALSRKYLRRFLKAARRTAAPLIIGLICGLGLFATSPQARADEVIGAEEEVGNLPMFQFQARFGPYLPDVDSEDGLTGTPFKDIFGSDSNFMFELGLDYEIWHGFGIVSAGGSFGFVQYLGKARTASGSVSSDTTVLNLVPLRLNVTYTFDKIHKWWDIPLMPYVTAGISYYIWWVLDGVGDVTSWEDDEGNSHKAQGGVFGGHVNIGLKLLLDVLDQEAASNLEDQVGIINSYFFAEFAMSWIDGFGTSGSMNLGDQTVMFGLMMEF
jgi:fibronectin type III domain protein